jgi:hypothetical protein
MGALFSVSPYGNKYQSRARKIYSLVGVDIGVFTIEKPRKAKKSRICNPAPFGSPNIITEDNTGSMMANWDCGVLLL